MMRSTQGLFFSSFSSSQHLFCLCVRFLPFLSKSRESPVLVRHFLIQVSISFRVRFQQFQLDTCCRPEQSPGRYSAGRSCVNNIRHFSDIFWLIMDNVSVERKSNCFCCWEKITTNLSMCFLAGKLSLVAGVLSLFIKSKFW